MNTGAAAGQEELFPAWRYHAVFTDSPFEMIQAEEHHRDHAIIEQVFAPLCRGYVRLGPTAQAARPR